jgi:hypothetical protein
MAKATHRNGKPLGKRTQKKRLEDFRCAWRNMNPESRRTALEWVKEQGLEIAPVRKRA